MSYALNALLASKHWQAYSLAIAYLAMLTFTCAPSVMVSSTLHLPFAYQLKADSPMADTAAVFMNPKDGESFHGYKLTPRIFGSILLSIAQYLNCHPYLPATIFGFFYLLCGITVAFQISGSKKIALYTGLLFAGLPGAAASFSVTWMPKPFDGIAIGLVALSVMFRSQPYLLLFSAFLACWTDERSILGLLYVLALSCTKPSQAPPTLKQYTPLIIIPIAILLYLGSRLLLSHILEWKAPDTSYMLLDISSWIGFAQLSAWVTFEGAWILILSAIATATKVTARLGLVSLAILPILTSFIALDVSRTVAFCFPVIFIFLAVLKASRHQTETLKLVALSAAVSLICPNLEVIVNSIVRWIPSLLYQGV